MGLATGRVSLCACLELLCAASNKGLYLVRGKRDLIPDVHVTLAETNALPRGALKVPGAKAKPGGGENAFLPQTESRVNQAANPPPSLPHSAKEKPSHTAPRSGASPPRRVPASPAAKPESGSLERAS